MTTLARSSRAVASRPAAKRALPVALLGAILVGLGALYADAHPSVSIVRDTAGNVYYSDIVHVWRLTPDGHHHVFVPRVHTHELQLDALDRVYGEHLWYDSAQSEPWQHYLWRAAPDRELEKLTPNRPGFRRDHGFPRDRAGSVYWTDPTADDGPKIRRRAPDGTITTIATGADVTKVGWLTCAPNGTVYFIRGDDLVRVTPQARLEVIARNLAETTEEDRSHLVQGLCADDAGTVHVAVSALGQIKRIAADGTVTVIDRSPAPWRPSGVLAADGELWILEYDPANRMRLRHRDAQGGERIHGPESGPSTP